MENKIVIAHNHKEWQQIVDTHYQGIRFFKNIYFSNRIFIALTAIFICFVVAYFIPLVKWLAYTATILLAAIVFIEIIALFFSRNKIYAQRQTPLKFSNGDQNTISYILYNTFPFPITYTLIDELPIQLQAREYHKKGSIASQAKIEIYAKIQPHERGEYIFEDLHLYISALFHIVVRRVDYAQKSIAACYPSYIKIRDNSFRSIIHTQSQYGSRLLKKKGSSTEFDSIKEYILGDDIRHINWKASARKAQLMTNVYTDEKSQQIYCIINMGRNMKMPFQGLTLLDHSINASLMLSYIALIKNDNVGLITFEKKVQEFLKPSRNRTQFLKINELLYKTKTSYNEPDMAHLSSVVSQKAGQRSLLLIFTNYETYTGFERHLAYYNLLSKKHLVCVIFFENTEVKKLQQKETEDIKSIYVSTIAEKYIQEKKKIIKALRQNGMLSIYTTPQNLSVDVINKYIELKVNRMI